ncbi:MAG TPA: hypothetical protein VM098_08655 [Phycisphaerae bacterium]|nr:hypothetical protein [Phycisphaerae bacterium]
MPVTGVFMQAAARMPDHGPTYLETRKYVAEGAARLIVEPWNTASCLLFLALAVFWLIRLRGQYRRHVFLAACLPLVAIGGVGGTVYHAFRAGHIWLMMDWMTILGLCLAVSGYLWSRLPRRWWYGLPVILAVVAIGGLGFRLVGGHRHGMGIAMIYSLMGLMIAVPAVAVLWKTHRRHGVYPLLALIFFAIALTMRTTDLWWPAAFPMGTHWLWHLFGAGAGQMVAEYVYRLSKDVPVSQKI